MHTGRTSISSTHSPLLLLLRSPSLSSASHGPHLLQTAAVRIAGATGDWAKLINGEYEASGQHNGWPVYRQVQDPEQWLLMGLDGSWWVTDAATKEAKDTWGLMHCPEQHVLLPTRAARWRVKTSRDYYVQSSVSVEGISPEDWAKRKVRVRFVLMCVYV